MVFSPKTFSNVNFPKISVNNISISYSNSVKYLGHILCSNLSDNDDISSQTRALYIRSNGIIRYFSNCNNAIKSRLFKSFCYPIYGSALWSSFSKSHFSKIRVAYNDAFRSLFKIDRYIHVSPEFVNFGISSFIEIFCKNLYSLYNMLINSKNNIIVNLCKYCIFSSKLWKIWCDHLFSKNFDVF
jgi:hypothetical protein